MKQCTTHHHACDCREAKFKRLLEAAKGIRNKMWPNEENYLRIIPEYSELEKAIKECKK